MYSIHIYIYACMHVCIIGTRWHEPPCDHQLQGLSRHCFLGSIAMYPAKDHELAIPDRNDGDP